MSQVVPSVAQALLLDELTASMAILDGGKVHLYTSPVPLTNEVAAADLNAVEASYDGYAAQTVSSWLAAGKQPDGKVGAASATLQFVATGTTTAETIYGWYYTDSAGTVLYLAVELESPVILGADTLSVLDVVPFIEPFLN